MYIYMYICMHMTETYSYVFMKMLWCLKILTEKKRGQARIPKHTAKKTIDK